MSKHSSLHDSAFKASMKDLVVAKDFFEAHLPKEILIQLNLSTLKLLDGSFVDEHLNAHMTDLLYQIEFNGEEGFLYLLTEHYTNASPFIPLYMLSYQCQIAKRYLEAHKENKKLPRIMGVMFYHGKRKPYPYSNLIEHCFVDPEFAKKYFLKGFHLIDITQVADDEIRQHKTAALMELLQKHCYARDFLTILKTFKSVLDYLVEVGAIHQIVYNSRYILEIVESKDINHAIDEISSLLPKPIRGDIMTIAEQLRQQGMQQGMQQGIQQAKLEMAKKMIAEGISIKIASKLTGLPVDSIKQTEEVI